MTFEEVDIWCRGYETRMARLKEVPRLIAAVLINANRKPHTPAISLEKVFPLYTDNQIKERLMTKEEFENFKSLKIKWRNKS
jgi:hypothetical protein